VIETLTFEDVLMYTPSVEFDRATESMIDPPPLPVK
jgi:hypothetical protein